MFEFIAGGYLGTRPGTENARNVSERSGRQVADVLSREIAALPVDRGRFTPSLYFVLESLDFRLVRRLLAVVDMRLYLLLVLTGCMAKPPADDAPPTPANNPNNPGMAPKPSPDDSPKPSTGAMSKPRPKGAAADMAGASMSSCEKLTCTDLGCGDHDDGCGGKVTCGACGSSGSCAPDSNEPNDSSSQATTLKDMSDKCETQDISLNINQDGDQDWFTFHASDTWTAGNPDVWVNDNFVGPPAPGEPGLVVTIYYICDSGGDNHSCYGTGVTPVTDQGLSGCQGPPNQVWLVPGCSGLDESGTVFMQVKAATKGTVCSEHPLTIYVGNEISCSL
jgi:hypothetical protein